MSVSEEFPHSPHRTLDGSHFDNSMDLWRSICASGSLNNTYFSIFFTKIDLLERQLDSGINFKDHVKAYEKEVDTQMIVALFWHKKYTEAAQESGYRFSATIHFFNLSFNDIELSMISMEQFKSSILKRHVRCNLCFRDLQ
ncbi:hypothetical protein CPB84DRAFT_1786840 [Gymnopilus junonius]|uniref:Uncharacterized protein n=1 Tax=Gymnopilus junonius TaxID=109634 RepID=A0A9P5NIS1_GYMJU|nr:hypothetical protein CPB84DRAFT_1786840 [Gymnopilus junonius]